MTTVAPVAPRRRMARADRRDQLLEVAEEVFAELGFGPASMDDVADRAGVTKPVLYDHFGSKDGLLAAVIDTVGQQMLAATDAAVSAAKTPEQALALGLTSYFRFVKSQAGAWSLFLREVAPGTEAAVAAEQVRQTQVDTIAALMSASLPTPDVTRATIYAHAVSGAAERLAALLLVDTTMSPKKATRMLMDVMWTGFAGLSDGSRWPV